MQDLTKLKIKYLLDKYISQKSEIELLEKIVIKARNQIHQEIEKIKIEKENFESSNTNVSDETKMLTDILHHYTENISTETILNGKKTEKSNEINTHSESEKEMVEHNESTSIRYKKLYHKIAKITHPDKVTDEERKELYLDFYKKATNAKENEEWLKLIEIGYKLNIDVIPYLELSELKHEVNKQVCHIHSIKNEFIWLWFDCENELDKRKMIYAYMKKMNG